MKAVAYIRVSSAEQATEDKVSLGIQEQDIRNHCQARGYELVKVYSDAGISGASRNRPAFQEMLKDAQAGLFDLIICWRGDRLTRGLRPTVSLRDALEGTEIEIEATNDFCNRRWLALRAAIAEEELEAIKERSRMGSRGRAQKGQIKGKVKYGYRMGSDGKPEIVESQAEVVRYIFREYAAGASTYTIARRLNQDAIPSPGGNFWWFAAVWDIISNPCYMGQGQWGRRRFYKKDTGNGKDTIKRRFQDEDNWIDIPYPPIIDEATFHAASLKRGHQTRNRVSRIEGLQYPLKGILWCQEHAKLYTTHYASNKKYLHRYYVCLSGYRYKDRLGPCSQPHINADRLEAKAINWVMDWLTEPNHLEALKYDYMARMKEGGGLETLEKARASLDALSEESKRVMIGYEKGWRSEEEVDLRMKAIKEQKEYYQEEFDRAEAATRDLQETIQWLTEMGELAQTEAYLEHIRAIPPHELLKITLRRINVTAEGLQFVLERNRIAQLQGSSCSSLHYRKDLTLTVMV